MSDDISAPFMDRRQQLATAALDNEYESIGARPAPPAPEPDQQVSDGPIKSAFSKIGAVAKDVGLGVFKETPRAIFTGARDAYQNTLNMAREFGDYLESGPFKDLPAGVTWDPSGIHIATGAELQNPDIVRPADYANIPHVMDNPKTITGGLIKGATQFLVSLKGINKLSGAAGIPEATGVAGYGLTALKGALASFAGFDPHQQRLSNLIQQFPALQNPVTDYLASKPDDNAAEGRFKNSLEGLGMGLVTDGFVKGVRLLRDAMQTKTALQEGIAQIAPQEASKEIEALLAPKPVAEGVATPEPPPLVVQPGVRASEKLAAAATRTTALTPDDVAGRMVAPLEPIASSAEGRAMEPAKTFINFARIDTPDDVQRAMQGLADSISITSDTTAQSLRDRIGTLDERLAELRNSKEFIETRGKADRFHGSSTELPSSLDDSFYSTMNIYGQGFYTTDALDVASGYTKKGLREADRAGTANPSLYKVLAPEAKLFDMERPLTDALKDALSKHDDLFGLAIESLPANAGLRSVFDEVRALSHGEGYSADTVQELFDSTRAYLEKAGYEGYQHVGGGFSGKAAHDVRIYWKPSTLLVSKLDPSGFRKIDNAQISALEAERSQLQSRVLDTAKAGVRSFDQMKLDAGHQNAWDALVSRQAGQPLSDSQMLAARQLWASATDKMSQLAQEAAASPSEANLFAFRKMLAVHNMIQNEVLGARASIARAQASMRIPVGTSAERLREIQFQLESAGGTDVARELAQAVDKMAKAGMISEMTTAAEKGAFARTTDAVKEAWTLGLLTSPKTHLKNIVSNAAFVPMQMAERATAAKFAQFLGDTGSVQPGEAAAQYFGMTQGAKDMFRYYAKLSRSRLLEGADEAAKVALENPIYETGLKDVGKMDLPPAISSEALKIDPSNWLGKAADGVGSAYGITSNALTAEDNFFKVLAYRMETHAQAFRQTQQEIAAGKVTPQEGAARMADLIASPPENIRLASADQALYQTFNEAPGWFGQMLLKAKRNSLFAHILVPFARTTANLQRAAFERTPLAPLVGQWRADIAAGGARRDLALARWALGSAAFAALTDATSSGLITGKGPVDPGQRAALTREGWSPYSVKVGDRWLTYNGISPVGDVMGMAADVAETGQHGEEQYVEGKDVQKLSASAVAAIAGNIMNKSYLSGLADVIDAIHDPNGPGATQWLNNMAGSVVPSGVAAATRAIDPNIHAVNSMTDQIRSRIPFLSKDLPVRHDLWGDPITIDSGWGKPFDVLSPIGSKKPTPEPIDRELLRLKANIEMPSASVTFSQGNVSVPVNLRQYPEVYERYVELAGNELKHPAWGLGAKDLLNQIIEGDHPLSAVYRLKADLPGGEATPFAQVSPKEEFIRSIIGQYRDLARRQILTEYPQIKGLVDEGRDQIQQLKMPVLQ